MDSNADASFLDRLAERMGIEPEFKNARGEIVRTKPEIKRALLAALGIVAADEREAAAALDVLERSEWQRPLPPVQVVSAEAGALVVEIVLPAGTRVIEWRLAFEDGGERAGRDDFDRLPLLDARLLDGVRRQRRRLLIPEAVPWGYHRLELPAHRATMTLIVTPERCWLPPALANGRRMWGIAAQLYLLRSDENWGIGDFSDLRVLVELAAARGADVIGLNPLHALFPDDPEHASPYSPASRLLLNVLNIDVTAVPEFAQAASLLGGHPRESGNPGPTPRHPSLDPRFRGGDEVSPAATESAGVMRLIASAEFQQRLRECRSRHLVDYAEVAALKLQTLDLLFDACRSDASPRWRQFEAFRREGGELLQRNCVFLALREHFANAGLQADWHEWPEDYRDPASPAVARFAAENRRQVEFLAWLQWVADEQLGAAATKAKECGMAIGLYRDLAVGADRAGAETWVNAAAVVSGAQVGAPPDIHMPAGQSWGLPPFHPHALREEGYRSFVELVRANMRHAGGLRIDHAMGLLHLYWVPDGEPPAAGAYVRYPIEDLVGILALESHRHRCLVVGEDLGTVPEGFRERMATANILSYRVLFFEQDPETSEFTPPGDYPELALAVVGSHDLPTLRGWWEGRDLDLKERFGLFPEKDEAARQRAARRRDRAQLVAALRREGVLPESGEPDIPTLSRAAHAYLARTPSILAMAQIDDLTDEADPVNLPATTDEHPNWRRRLSMTLDELARRPRFLDITENFRAERAARPERQR
ncbi:MAG TPA: 4-alpha-glucanotransferase [Stellaceae bacterium]|nr:4-alpha-glucanotransferase [Stellaceae bacterium]